MMINWELNTEQAKLLCNFLYVNQTRYTDRFSIEKANKLLLLRQELRDLIGDSLYSRNKG